MMLLMYYHQSKRVYSILPCNRIRHKGETFVIAAAEEDLTLPPIKCHQWRAWRQRSRDPEMGPPPPLPAIFWQDNKQRIIRARQDSDFQDSASHGHHNQTSTMSTRTYLNYYNNLKLSELVCLMN